MFAKTSIHEERTLAGTGGQALHGIERLRVESRLGTDQGCSYQGKAGKDEEDELGEEFVLARLAGEDDDEGFTIPSKHRLEDGFGSLQLVRPEADANHTK